MTTAFWKQHGGFIPAAAVNVSLRVGRGEVVGMLRGGASVAILVEVPNEAGEKEEIILSPLSLLDSNGRVDREAARTVLGLTMAAAPMPSPV